MWDGLDIEGKRRIEAQGGTKWKAECLDPGVWAGIGEWERGLV